MSNLRIAGPTPLAPNILKAVSKQMINHRGPLYEKLHSDIVRKLKHFFGTKDDIYLFTSSGTGAMEAAIVNFFSPGDKLLAFPCGVFGDRWVKIAQAFGASVVVTSFPMGKPVDITQVKKVVKNNPNAKGAMITHCETSTAVVNDIKAFSAVVNKYNPQTLVLVDSIAAMGGVSFEMDKWGIDVAVTGSQKAWGAPPGISMIGVSKRAKTLWGQAKMHRYYFDLRLMEKYALKNQTPTTPAVASLYGLNCALDNMLLEGKENIYDRHLKLRNQLRAGVAKLGLKLMSPPEFASPTITAIKVPQGIDAFEWTKLLRTKYNTIVSGGKGALEGKVIRVAHMGYVSKKDIDEVQLALKKSLLDI